MTLLALGAVAVALTAWCMWRAKAPKASVWLALLGGLTVGAGMLGSGAVTIAHRLADANGRGTAYLFGAAIPAVVAVLMLAELVHAGHPRKGRPHRFAHPIIAFLAPAVLLTAGGIFAQLVGWGHEAISTIPGAIASTGR